MILVGKVIKGKYRQDNKIIKYFTVSSLLYLMTSIFISPANIAEISSGILSRETSRSETKCLKFPCGWRYMLSTIKYFYSRWILRMYFHFNVYGNDMIFQSSVHPSHIYRRYCYAHRFLLLHKSCFLE